MANRSSFEVHQQLQDPYSCFASGQTTITGLFWQDDVEALSYECTVVIGNVKVKVDPAPSRLVTRIAPPCSSTNLREIASPSPVPSALFEALPTWRNSSNTAMRSSAAMPTPVS